MTGQRFSVRALAAPGAADGTYGLAVVDGLVTGVEEVGETTGTLPTGGATGEVLAKASSTDFDAAFVESSVPVILLPNGSDASDVPAGTPVGAIILTKG